VDGGSRGAVEYGPLYTGVLDSSRLLMQVFLQNETRTVVMMVIMIILMMTVTVMLGRSKAQYLIVSLRCSFRPWS